MTQPTRTGLKFAQLANGSMVAQYKTHSVDKADEIALSLRLTGYTVKNIDLLHTKEFLLVITVANANEAAFLDLDIEAVKTDFKVMWRAMRADQKGTLSAPSMNIPDWEKDLYEGSAED